MKTPREILFSLLIRAWRPTSFLLTPLERKAVAEHKEKGKDHAPIFILGPPRCGSTFTYQLLTENFRVEYFDNLQHALFRTPFLGNRLSHIFFDERRHGSFTSKGGSTIRDGWHAPSECGPFWNKKIRKDLPDVGPEDLSTDQKRALHDPIRAIMGARAASLLIKNLLSIERFSLIRELFPEARFIHVKRDPIRTALSIRKEREKLGIPEEAWWSARPSNYQELITLPLAQRIAGQVHYLEKDIQEALEQVPEERKTQLRFEELLRDPKPHLQSLQESFLSELELRGSKWSFPEKREPKQGPTPEELAGIEDGFHKLGISYE